MTPRQKIKVHGFGLRDGQEIQNTTNDDDFGLPIQDCRLRLTCTLTHGDPGNVAISTLPVT